RASAVVADRTEESGRFVAGVAGGLQILAEQLLSARVQRNVAHLAAFAMHPQVRHAAARMDILHGKPRELLAPQAVIEQQGEKGAVALRLEVLALGELHEMPRLGIAQRRRLALVAFDLGAPDTL